MSEALPYLVWLDDALDAVTDDHLYPLDHDDGIFSVTLTRERNALPGMSVTMAHPGWALLSPDQQRGAALVLSTDGTMATAVVRARGYLRAMPSALTGDEITLQFECSPEDVDDRKEAAAQAVVDADAAAPGVWADTGLSETDPSIRGGTTIDRLFGQLDKLADEVLQSKTAWWRFDPVTYGVTLLDDAVAVRVHNLGDGYDPDSIQISEGDGAVEQVKWTIHASISETATGTCDIASRVSRQTSLLGYTASGGADMTKNIGWSLSGPVIEQTYSEGLPSDTGRVFRVVSRRIFHVLVPGPNGTTVTATTYTSPVTTDYYERQRRRVQTTYFKRWLASYNFSQTRRETFELTLDVPCQRAGGIKRVLDLGEASLGDLYGVNLNDQESAIAVEGDDASEGFEEGSYQLLAGRLYRAVRDTTSPVFEFVTTRRNGSSVRLNEDWVDANVQAALPNRLYASFADTPRGKAMMAHAFLRMRKAALKRLTSWTVTLTCDRADLPDVELEDQVLFLLPARWDQPGREVQGRVLKVVETWDGEAGDTVTLTLAVALGTGFDGQARLARLTRYGGEGYFSGAGAYLPQPTAYLSAGDDVEFTVDADPLVRRIVCGALSDPAYSLRDITYRGSAAQQEADFIAAAARGLEPTAAVTKPTEIEPTFLPLIAEKLIKRTVRGQGSLLFSPQGLDLSGGA